MCNNESIAGRQGCKRIESERSCLASNRSRAMNSKRFIESVVSEYGFVPFNNIKGCFKCRYSNLASGLRLMETLAILGRCL